MALNSRCTHGALCSATTHTDIALRAKLRGIPVNVVHNASIMNAVCAGCPYRAGNVGAHHG
jgi:diphthine methyl ester synthase